jgi:hypothetical protein
VGLGYSSRSARSFKQWSVDRALGDLSVSDKCDDQGGSIQCLTFVRGFEGCDQDGNESVNDQTYDADGKTYRKTGAHYGLAFEPQGGCQ